MKMTDEEFQKAFLEHAKNLVLDIRANTHGYASDGGMTTVVDVKLLYCPTSDLSQAVELTSDRFDISHNE